MDDFNHCINSCGLTDWRMEGKQFSWCNGHQGLARSWAKLDKVLVNHEFASKFGDVVAHFFNWKTSDHSPICFRLSRNSRDMDLPCLGLRLCGLHMKAFCKLWKIHGMKGLRLLVVLGFLQEN